MLRRISLIALWTLAVTAGCTRHSLSLRSAPVVAAAPIAPDARTIAVYRTVADSIYVRTTERPVAVVTTTLDTTCTTVPCIDVIERWGLASLWWAGSDSTWRIGDMLLLSSLQH